jgi:transcriptional regulator with XRE-family HTH domain
MSNAIKYWREHHKPFISQKELAEKVNIDRPTLSKIENSNIPIDPDEILAEKIARILGVLVTDILRKPAEE